MDIILRKEGTRLTHRAIFGAGQPALHRHLVSEIPRSSIPI